MTGLWCLLARTLLHRPTIGAPIRHYGNPIARFVVIGIGALVMYESGSFGLSFSLMAGIPMVRSNAAVHCKEIYLILAQA